MSLHAAPEIAHFFLQNGLEVVVIPDRRAPVVTHMVYYRNGAADDPAGKSGIAHFLEHLMFKGTEKNPKGAFSETVAGLGGQENAFTSYDYTAYYQRVAKAHLGTMMAMEADRMTGLMLAGPEVLSERDVVIEERKMRTESDPSAELQETMLATLYVHHPYGTPVIGWAHEIEDLQREDALAYYRRFYRPDNAILIVAGDVNAEDVRKLAEAHYGAVPVPDSEKPRRKRLGEPPLRAARLVSLHDKKVEQPLTQQAFIVPAQARAEGDEAFALEVLNQILGKSQTSRLYRALVVEQAIAVNTGSWYWNDALDMGQFGVYAVPAEGVSLAALDDAVASIMRAMHTTLVSEKDLARAKTRLIADMIYAQDSQTHLARIYGAALTTGGTLEDVTGWPDKIRAVTAEAVQAVARRYLVPGRGVTGHLLKDAA